MATPSTHPSLLSEVRDPRDVAAWTSFDRRYAGLILRVCARSGLQLADAEDVRQAVMIELARSLRGFRYDRSQGRFRAYVARAVRNEVIRHFRRHERRPSLLIDSDGSTPSIAQFETLWEDEWRLHHYRTAMRELRQKHNPRALAMFDMLLQGASIRTTAEAFAVTEDVVRQAKVRIKRRLSACIAAQIEREDALE